MAAVRGSMTLDNESDSSLSDENEETVKIDDDDDIELEVNGSISSPPELESSSKTVQEAPETPTKSTESENPLAAAMGMAVEETQSVWLLLIIYLLNLFAVRGVAMFSILHCDVFPQVFGFSDDVLEGEEEM